MIVIADDITGAAEIAGIAFTHSEQVRLLCGGVGHGDNIRGTTVIATDTRSMTKAEAVAETHRIAHLLSLTVHPSSSTQHIFKKTDSALRGHVVAELSALMEATGYQRAVYLPSNPSKGRVIRAGVYYIDDKPIHETAFSFDPEFPARTSSLKERFPDAEGRGIVIPDAEREDDIRRIINEYDDGKTLFAGAADLFKQVLSSRVWRSRTEPSVALQCEPIDVPVERLLILCGSTQSKPLTLGIPVAPMPRTVYDGEQTAADWFNQLSTLFPSGEGWGEALILTIPHTHRTGKAVAVHLRTVMAEMTRRLVSLHQPTHLMIEGGATAWATLQALGWTDFTITSQLAPGVVQMRATNGTFVTLKPGSYPWGNVFQRTTNLSANK